MYDTNENVLVARKSDYQNNDIGDGYSLVPTFAPTNHVRLRTRPTMSKVSCLCTILFHSMIESS